MSRSRLSLAACLVVLTAVGAPVMSQAHAAVESLESFGESTLQVCQSESGSLRTGDLDVIILLDNSKSLWESDKFGARFDAIDGFVDSFQKIEDRTKNFSLVKFGGSAEVVIPFTRVTNSNDVREIKDGLRENVPNDYQTQESFTNYVAALDLAREEFLSNDPGNRNCRVLIWFTDGVFDTNDSGRPEEIKNDVNRLEKEVCASDGLGVQYSRSDINTFVVYLTPRDPNPDRSRISQDAMQVITGDREPSFSSQESSPRAPSSGCVIGERHLGEVISVEDTNSLLGYLTDLVPTAGGATPIFPEECPIPVANLRSQPLIDGNLVDWISVTTWDESLNAETLSIDLGDGKSQPMSSLFDADVKGDRLYYYRPKGEARELLDAGWTISLVNAGDICVRLKPRSLQFEIGRDNVAKSLDGLPEALFGDGRLKLYVAGKEADFKLALKNPGELTAQLVVDSGEFLATPNRLPVTVIVNGAFQVTPPSCAIEVEADGNVPTSPLQSTSCLVTPAADEDTRYDASTLLAALDACGIGPWQLLVDGIPAAPSDVVKADGSPVELSVATVDDPRNQATDCKQSLATAITISTKEASSQIGAELQLDLLKRGSVLLAILFAAGMALLVAFLSLLLLKGISFVTARTVDGNHFFAYETAAEIEPDKSARGVLRWPETGQTPKNYIANPDLLEPVKTDNKRTALSAGELRFEREIPRLFRPFSESRLKMLTPTAAVFWQPNRERDGLPLTFARAIVLSRVSKEDLTVRRNMKVRVTVLVPRRGPGSGYSGAEELIREKAEQLAADLWEAATESKAVETRGDSFGLPSAPTANENEGPVAVGPATKVQQAEAPKPPKTPPLRSLPSEPPTSPR